MGEFNFSLDLQANWKKLFKIATDYENFTQFFPDQIKSIKIIEKNNHITTEEILVFSTKLKSKILQKSSHEIIGENKILSKIISGPFNGSSIEINFEEIDKGTNISVHANVKIELKYRILAPIIMKKYKMLLTALCYKMNTLAITS